MDPMDRPSPRKFTAEELPRVSVAHLTMEELRGVVKLLETTLTARTLERDTFRAAAEEAMHGLLYLDAHFETERVPLAEKVAKIIGHPWPPYPEKEDDDE